VTRVHRKPCGFTILLLALLWSHALQPAQAETRSAVLLKLGIELVRMPGGSFRMGSTSSEAGGDEQPVVSVNVSPFTLMKHEVTVGQYRAFARATGRALPPKADFAQSDSHPAVNVSYEDALAFAAWLSRESGRHFRLPSEAEWEYAARAGNTQERPATAAEGMCEYGNVFDQVAAAAHPEYRWSHHDCSDGFAATAPVGSMKPNAMGVADMLGNVWEWTEDCWYDRLRTAPAGATRGSAAIIGPLDCRRSIRGGGWGDQPSLLRFSNRYWARASTRRDDLGFRLASDF
jgi:formylglycine-generating enzyme required for sulfatase activity